MVKNTFRTFISVHYPKLLSVGFFALLFSAYIYAFANPPVSPYQGGVTLDPTCAPGSTNCFVQILPDQTGNSGKFLTTDGSVTSWASTISTPIFNNTTLTGTTTLSGFTQGSILFIGASGVVSQNNSQFLWDNTNNRLGITTVTPASKIDITTNSLGTTQTNSSGIVLANNTAAAVGAQQISPAIRWRGNGWKTNATAGSQTVDFQAYVLPTQGSSTPFGTWKLQSSINGGSYVDVLSVGQGGAVTTASSLTTFSVILNNGGNLQLVGGSTPIFLNNSTGSTGQVLTSAGTTSTPTWTTLNSITTTGLTNGSGTTANGTAVDLGGTLTQNTTLNDQNSLSFQIGSNGSRHFYSDPNNDLYGFGDVDSNNQGSRIEINDSSKVVSFTANANAEINMDSRGGVFKAGDINGNANNTLLSLDDFAQIIRLKASSHSQVYNDANTVVIGDVDANVNNTKLTIDDNNQQVYLYNSRTGFSADVFSGVTNIGDWQGVGNGTKLFIDDINNYSYFPSGNLGVGTTNPNIFKLQVSGSVGPENDNSYDLGSVGNRWVNVYANNFIGSVTPSGFTQGSVVFAGSGGVLSQDNANVYFDDTANEFRIGSNTDLGTYSLQVTGGIRVDGTAANEVQFTGNNSFNPGFVFNGSSSNTHMYTFDSQNLSTSTGGQTVFTNSFIQLSGTSYIQPYQQNLRVIRTYPGTGTANTLEVDNTTENAVPGTYRIALFKLSGVDKAYIDQTGGAWFSGNVGVGTASPTGKFQLGELTSNGVNSYMVIGHNGTTSSSNDGTSTIRFASQFSNYPYTLGAEGNGYNFYLRQNNTNQGAINMDFSGTGTLVFQKTATSLTQPIDITTDKNFNLYTSGADKYLSIFSSTSSLNGSAAPDNVYLARPIVGSGYERTSEPVVTIRNGLPSVASDNVVGNKAYWYRNGYIGIGTANTDANTTNPLKAALTINQGTLTGYANNTHATASNVKTIGSSTTVTFTPDNGNTNVTYGIIVGSKITANGTTRTVTSVSQSSVVVDSTVDWSNGGSGYPFTYRNPYINISDGTTGVFGIDPSGNVGIGTTAPATILNVVSSSTTPILRIESNAAGSVAVTPTLDFTSSNSLFNTTVSRIEASTGSGIPLLNFYVHNGTTLKNRFTIDNNGDLTQQGDSARSSQGIYFNSVNPGGSKFIKVTEQNATSQTGEGLTLEAGTANASSTDKSGGDINIIAGSARGTGSSNIIFKTAASGASGTGANVSTERMKITGAGSAIFTPTVSTGTGSTAGMQILANSLTSGNGLDVSSSSLTSGNLVSLSSTSTGAASNTQTVLNVSTSGANPVNQTTYGGYFSNTHTGTNSVNTALYATASGGSSNYAANFGATLLMSATSPCVSFQLGTCSSSDNFINRSGTQVTVQGSGAVQLAVGGTSYLDAVTSKVRLFTGGSGEVLIGTSTDAGAFSLQSVGNTYINPNAYANAVGGLTLARSGNFTGVAAETALDLSVKPSLTLTEPGSGTFTWNGGDIDMSSIAVTAGAGTTVLNALRLAGVSDADVGTVRGLFVANLSATAATEEAIHTGTGWDYAAIFEAGNVGIQNTAPGFALHVGSSATTDSTTLIRLEDANSTCDFNANAGGPTCGSDVTLKKDITSLDNTDILNRVSQLNPVSYHWLTDDSSAGLQYGFIAQEVEAQFPNLVSEHTWIDGSTKKFLNMGGLVPYLAGAIKELDIKVKGLSSLDITDSASLGSLVKQFLADVGNGIESIFVKKIHTEELCVKKSDGSEICVTGDQLDHLINGTTTTSGGGGSSGGGTPPPTATDICPNIDGDQATVPDGMHLDDTNNCVANDTPPPTDTGGSGGSGDTGGTPPPSDQPQP